SLQRNMSSGRMPGFAAHVATTSLASVSMEIAWTSMYGAMTSESPAAVITEVFMSCTSLAMSEPDTRSSVFAPSSLMLHSRWRRISKVIGSTRIFGPDAALAALVAAVFTAIRPSLLVHRAGPGDAHPLQRAPVLDLSRVGPAQVQLRGQVERELLGTLRLDDPAVLLGDIGVAFGEDLVGLVEREVAREPEVELRLALSDGPGDEEERGDVPRAVALAGPARATARDVHVQRERQRHRVGADRVRRFVVHHVADLAPLGLHADVRIDRLGAVAEDARMHPGKVRE